MGDSSDNIPRPSANRREATDTDRLVTHPDYLLVRELGRGGMGVVYEAEDTRTQQTVAFKVLLHGPHAGREAMERFRTEGEALARLRHPHVVQILETGTYGGLPYLALEYCGGGSLAGPLHQGPLTPTLVADYGEAVARGLSACHAAGVVHRDLKPANILLTSDGTVKVTDFGLAKLFDRDGRTRTGIVLGTPDYMSPEQARHGEVGPSTDVWALGAILYECLTGRAPFTGRTDLETLERIHLDEPVRPGLLRKGVPEALERIVLRCLEKEPGDRYPTMLALADDLGRWRRGEPILGTRLPLGRRLGRAWNRQRGKAIALLLLAVVGVSYLALADARLPMPGGDLIRTLADRGELSLFRPAPKRDDLQQQGSSLRKRLSRHLLATLQSSSDGLVPLSLGSPQSEPPDAWTQGQVVAALCLVPESELVELRESAQTLRHLFEPGGRIPEFIPGVGWALDTAHGDPAAEPALWVTAALAAVLARPGVLEEPERMASLERLQQVQEALESYRGTGPDGRPTGGWNMFPRQVQPDQASPYSTALALRTLLELRRAELPWLGSFERRDELIESTAAWLLAQYDGRGWRCPGTQPDEFSDGLSLILFALLLRAEAEAGVQLPDEVVQQIPRHLEDCGNRDLRYTNSTGIFLRTYHLADGQTRQVERAVRFLWYPWAIQTAARWRSRAQRLQMSHEHDVQARRLLGHLVLRLGPSAVDDAVAGYTYVAAELVLALNTLDR